MNTMIASSLLLLLAGAVAADPLAKFEHDEFQAGAEKLTIYFLGHGTLMMTWGKLVIQVDPVSEYADYKKLPKADLILVTHEHFDHLDPKAVTNIAKKDAKIVLNQAGRKKLGKGEALANGDSLEFKDIRVKVVPAYNTTESRQQFHPRGGRDNGYVLSLGGMNIYISGDTEDIPEMAQFKDIDIVFLSTNQPYTMTPQQFAHAVEMIKPKVAYPYHYGDTDLSGLGELLKDEKGTELRIRKMK
jgi:L-ascorbate metabolism protein UlaG (beta-lactamase superfamily)